MHKACHICRWSIWKGCRRRLNCPCGPYRKMPCLPGAGAATQLNCRNCFADATIEAPAWHRITCVGCSAALPPSEILAGIIYVLRHGLRWRDLPQELVLQSVLAVFDVACALISPPLASAGQAELNHQLHPGRHPAECTP